MLLSILSLVTISVTVLLAFYLWRVPESSVCPRCGRPTTALSPDARGPRWSWPVEQFTVVASCPHCGWHGRMRRAPKVHAVRSRHPAGKGGQA